MTPDKQPKIRTTYKGLESHASVRRSRLAKAWKTLTKLGLEAGEGTGWLSDSTQDNEHASLRIVRDRQTEDEQYTSYRVQMGVNVVQGAELTVGGVPIIIDIASINDVAGPENPTLNLHVRGIDYEARLLALLSAEPQA